MANQLVVRLVRLNLVYHTRIKNSITPNLILFQCYVCMRIVQIEIDNWNPIIIQLSKSHLKCKKYLPWRCPSSVKENRKTIKKISVITL